ncbi:hypothetical protein A6R68_17850, partial [Neotoma lepida]
PEEHGQLGISGIACLPPLLEYEEKVHTGLIPEQFFQFLYPKTEINIINPETFSVISVVGLTVYVIQNYSASIGEFIDKLAKQKIHLTRSKASDHQRNSGYNRHGEGTGSSNSEAGLPLMFRRTTLLWPWRSLTSNGFSEYRHMVIYLTSFTLDCIFWDFWSSSSSSSSKSSGSGSGGSGGGSSGGSSSSFFIAWAFYI